jgi:hypothetical protein
VLDVVVTRMVSSGQTGEAAGVVRCTGLYGWRWK